jgi:hypothetical protein
MRIQLRYLLAAGAVAAVCGAPVAAAQPDCTNVGGTTTECSSPGNVQINAGPPVSEFTLPYWDETFGSPGFYQGPYPVPYDEGDRR